MIIDRNMQGSRRQLVLEEVTNFRRSLQWQLLRKLSASHSFHTEVWS